MQNSFILDCSVTMSWCFEDEVSEYGEHALDSLKAGSAIVPSIWELEVSKVLISAHRRGRVDDKGIFHFLSLLEKLPIKIYKNSDSIKDVVLLSQKYNLSSYDSTYLSLSLNQDLPLATQDQKLQKAILDAGGTLYNT